MALRPASENVAMSMDSTWPLRRPMGPVRAARGARSSSGLSSVTTEATGLTEEIDLTEALAEAEDIGGGRICKETRS